MIEITTSSSIRVNPPRLRLLHTAGVSKDVGNRKGAAPVIARGCDGLMSRTVKR